MDFQMTNIFFKCKQLHVHVFEKSFLNVKLGVFVDKWRPRRTIIFCSWGAEEYGLIGSTEWIEVFRITHVLALCVPVVRVFVVELTFPFHFSNT